MVKTSQQLFVGDSITGYVHYVEYEGISTYTSVTGAPVQMIVLVDKTEG
jgi:hypothetical protein